MTYDNTIDKPKKFAIITNSLLLVINFLLAIGIIVLNFSRDRYTEISKQIFTEDTSLMNSSLLDAILRKETSILIIVFLAFLVIKEKRIKHLKNRILYNIYAFICLMIYEALLLYLIYSPIIHAGQ